MRPVIFHFPKETQNTDVPAVFTSGNFRKKLRNKCNGFLTAAAKFLRSLISESDQTHTRGETSRRRSVHAVDSLPEPSALLPWMDLGMNARSFTAQKGRSAHRRAEVLGMNNPCADVYKNNVTKYPEARDIRPLQLKTRHMCTLRETHRCGIVKRGGLAGKNLGKEERRTQTRHSRMSNQKKDLDIYVIPPSVQVKQKRQSKNRGNMVAGTKDFQFERAVRGRRLRGKADRRLHSRKCEEDGKVDWVKYERDRKMWPPVCKKRRRETTIESILEEPELKLRRMGE